MKEGYRKWRFEEHEQPELHRYMMRSARIYSFWFTALVAVIGLAVMALWPRWEPAFVTYWGWMLACNLALWHATGHARRVAWVELTITAQSLSLANLIASSFWLLDQPMHPNVGSMVWLGPLMGALFPMHLRVGLFCYAGLTLSVVLGAWLAPSSAIGPVDVLLSLPMGVMLGLLASQLRRKQWWERHREALQASSGQRMMEMGRRAAAISHELKTPLAASSNSLHSATELVQEWRQSVGHPDVGPQDMAEILEELQRDLRSAEGNFTRIRSFLEALKQQNQPGASVATRHGPFDLAHCVEDVVEMMHQAGHLGGIEIQTSGVRPGHQVEGSATYMEQILLNLLENAESALRGHPQPQIRVWLEGQPPQMRLLFQDNGPGIPEAMRARVFEAMVTTRQAQGRTGLGLSMCRDLAQGVFEGDLTLLDRPGGACFALELPSLTPSAPPTLPRAGRPARGRSTTVIKTNQ